MLRALVAILAGLLLLADSMGRLGGLEALIQKLKPYETTIGVVALILGILSFFSPLGIVMILAGLLLGANTLATVPRVGDELGGASRALAPFGVLIGGAVLVLGILAMF